MVTKAPVTEPWYVHDRRVAKAAQIAGTLRSLGAKADDVARFTPEDRRDAEAAAAVTRPGSDATWRIVTGMIAGSGAPDALCPTCVLGDPQGVNRPPQRFGHEGRCSR
jgi:hypothetical protein